MVSAPYLLRLHPTFLGATSVPVPRGPSLFLRAADGGFTRSHRHLFSLPKAPPFARVGSEPRPPEERSYAARALLRAWGSDERRGGGSWRGVGKKRALSSLQPRRDACVAHGDRRERGAAG